MQVCKIKKYVISIFDWKQAASCDKIMYYRSGAQRTR